MATLLGRLGAAVLAGALAACSPTYDWRELDVADGAARAAFPARVRTESRTVTLDGTPLAYTLDAARVDQAVFAVGHASLADVPDARRQALAQALMRSLYQNLKATPPADFPAPGSDIAVRGEAGGKPVLLLARVWLRGDLLIEAVATGPEDKLPRAEAETFVHSLQFRQ
ncbi:hypothetical protein C7R54_25030 [Achromobacter aloeverae]|uniref:DUF1795 domain-containing protein n=1 Tax=Achromobacter aloeverae TaxID=1750518 RepID=A0A4Q1HEP9_9BURK|nr:hypothetical protein C7R54_25030 [Achromobacter aloeverae]